MGKKEEKKVLQSLFVQAVGARSLFFILGFIFSTTWIASIIYDVLKDGNGRIVLFLVSAATLFVLFLYSKKLQKEFASDDNIDINLVKTDSKKILVIFLSDINEKTYIGIPQKIDANTASQWLNPNNGYNKWKMPYESIKRHKTALEVVYVLTSPESAKQLNQFKKIIRHTSKRKFNIVEVPIREINNAEEYNKAFNHIYSKSKKYREKEIVIDVTSGTKLYSIAGSYFALSTEKIIQYIDSDYMVRQFNNKVLSEDK